MSSGASLSDDGDFPIFSADQDLVERSSFGSREAVLLGNAAPEIVVQRVLSTLAARPVSVGNLAPIHKQNLTPQELNTVSDRERRPANPAVTAFSENLRAAFIAAGPPTYARLAAIMLELQEQDFRHRTLGKSTLQRLLVGKNTTLPRWEVVSAVIHALRAAAEESGLDPEAVGSLTHWRQRLTAATRTAADPTPALRDLMILAQNEDDPD